MWGKNKEDKREEEGMKEERTKVRKLEKNEKKPSEKERICIHTRRF